MLDEKNFTDYSADAVNNLVSFNRSDRHKEQTPEEYVAELEQNHEKSISILAEHQKISNAEAKDFLEKYLTGADIEIDQSDERLKRILNIARKTFQSLPLELRHQQSFKKAA